MIGTAAFGSAWRTSTCKGRETARIGGADIVLAEHFKQAGARHAREQRDINDGQRERGQDERAQPWFETICDAAVALNRQPLQLDREDVDQRVADDEGGHGKAHDRKAHDDAVEQAASAHGREYTERHRDGDRDDQREGGERERRLDAIGDQAGHALLEEEALAEIAVQQGR